MEWKKTKERDRGILTVYQMGRSWSNGKLYYVVKKLALEMGNFQVHLKPMQHAQRTKTNKAPGKESILKRLNRNMQPAKNIDGFITSHLGENIPCQSLLPQTVYIQNCSHCCKFSRFSMSSRLYSHRRFFLFWMDMFPLNAAALSLSKCYMVDEV